MTEPSVQEQARALGDPTRHAIFQFIADAGAPVTVAELTEHLGLNHTAIRQHLAKLVDAGLVVASTAAPVGRGRPRLEYRVDPTADGRWGVAGPYERLAVQLTEVVATGAPAIEVGRRWGRDSVPDRAASGDVDAVEVLVEVMARHGFDPRVRRRGDDVEVTLQRCPFASAVLTDAQVVCDLHRGLAEGVLEVVGGASVTSLVPKDPRRAHCRLTCRAAPS